MELVEFNSLGGHACFSNSQADRFDKGTSNINAEIPNLRKKLTEAQRMAASYRNKQERTAKVDKENIRLRDKLNELVSKARDLEVDISDVYSAEMLGWFCKNAKKRRAKSKISYDAALAEKNEIIGFLDAVDKTNDYQIKNAQDILDASLKENEKRKTIIAQIENNIEITMIERDADNLIRKIKNTDEKTKYDLTKKQVKKQLNLKSLIVKENLPFTIGIVTLLSAGGYYYFVKK